MMTRQSCRTSDVLIWAAPLSIRSLQNKALSALRTSGGHLSDIRPPEIEIELEKEIEIKREIEKVRPETGHPSHTYGHYQNVFLTDEELADLQASFPAVWEQYIEKLSEYTAFLND